MNTRSLPAVPADDLVACSECARAVGLGWWGSISRHSGPVDKPVCLLCQQGEATLTAAQWFAMTAALAEHNARTGSRRTWHDDALIGIGAARPEDMRRAPHDDAPPA